MFRLFLVPCVLCFLIALAVCLYAIDEARGRDSEWSVDRVQATLENSWEHAYDVELIRTGESEFAGTATAKDGAVFTLRVWVEGRRLNCEGWSATGNYIGLMLDPQPPGFWEAHPRLELYVYAVAFCGGVFGFVYPLLRPLGLRQPRTRGMERLLSVCAVINFALAVLMAYMLLTKGLGGG